MYNAKLKFMQFASEDKYKNSEFPIIIDFYASFLEKRVYKSSIHNAKLIFI